MLENVADEYVLPLQIDRGENLGKKLARLTDERSAGLVFFCARGFSDADHFRSRISFTRNGVGRGRVQRATRALLYLRGDFLQGIELLDRAGDQLSSGGCDDDAF